MRASVDLARRRHRLAGLRVSVASLRLQIAIKAGFRQDQPRNELGRWSGGSGSGGVRVTRVDRTGDPKIDRTTDDLLDIAAGVMRVAGPGEGKLYGVTVHAGFAEAVRSLNLPGIGRDGVEQSFSVGGLVRYGLDGSIRTDVVKRDGRTASAPIVAVWDLKTGSAKLTASRAREIRANLGIDESIPIIEIHVTRGVDVKSIRVILHA